MNRKIQHTPDGVRDIIRNECEEKHVLEQTLRNMINSYGYRDIETPTFEYFDVFGSEVGTIPSNELYKFFDRDGSTLVLRPDFTPSIARAASRYFTEEYGPVRLCYLGNTFINHNSYRGHLKEATQLGAELIMDSSEMADAEMLALSVDTLKKAGLDEFLISLGDVRFFESLAEEAGIDKDTQEELKELIRNKNSFGVENLLRAATCDECLKKVFSALPNLIGGVEILEKAKNMLQDGLKESKAIEALDRLQKIYEILCMYGVEKYVSIDLGMMSSYMYYTGIIFRAYTYGTGEAVIKGGRYDHLLQFFGTDAPAVGFVVVLEQLMNAMRRQKIAMPGLKQKTLILYTAGFMKEAIDKAQSLRNDGACVELRMIGTDENREYSDYDVIRMEEQA